MSEPNLTSEPVTNVVLAGYLHRLDWSAEQFVAASVKAPGWIMPSPSG